MGAGRGAGGKRFSARVLPRAESGAGHFPVPKWRWSSAHRAVDVGAGTCQARRAHCLHRGLGVAQGELPRIPGSASSGWCLPRFTASWLTSGALCGPEVQGLCSALWNSHSCPPLARRHNSTTQSGKLWTFRGSFDVGGLFFCTVYWDQRDAHVNNCFRNCGCCAPRTFRGGHSAVSLVAVDAHCFISSVTVGFCSCTLAGTAPQSCCYWSSQKLKPQTAGHRSSTYKLLARAPSDSETPAPEHVGRGMG